MIKRLFYVFLVMLLAAAALVFSGIFSEPPPPEEQTVKIYTVVGIAETLAQDIIQQAQQEGRDGYPSAIYDNLLEHEPPDEVNTLSLLTARSLILSPEGTEILLGLRETNYSTEQVRQYYRDFKQDSGYLWFAVESASTVTPAEARLTLAGGSEPGELPVSGEVPGDGTDQAIYNVVLLEHFNPRIGLYTGLGSWPESIPIIKDFLDTHEIDWDEINEADIRNLDLYEMYDAVWLPGGFFAQYRWNVDHGSIREFVDSGGVFIGTCAGAYYAADTIVWDGNSYDYTLKLFDGQAVGRFPGYGVPFTVELDPGYPFNLAFGQSLEMLYADGPYFVPVDDDSVHVLARYAHNGEPAIINASYGDGAVLLMGPHPELSYSNGSYHGGDGAQWAWLYAALEWMLK